MTPWIFSLVIAISLYGTPILAEDNSSSGSSSTTTEDAAKELAKLQQEKLREQNKLQRDARKKALETAKSARDDKKLETAKDLAEKLVSERSELLKKLSTGEHTKKCRAAAKTEATAAVNAAIARLGQVDTSSAATTDAIRTLIKNDIIGKNRVYVSLLPAVRGMCASDRLIGLIDSKLTPLVDRIESNGSDVSTIRTELASAKSDAEKAYLAYKAVANNPGTTSYKTDLSSAKALLKSAKTHLSTARDAIDALKTSSDDTTPESTN